ncbi:hypothetical protein ACIQUS_15710 [Pseudomonas sp. NPDC090755]|uniref:hypothetical protein n=1 Tax=Pseudomonas sp. NPDC090755 TaxID=3364481 RepID=UPI00383ABC78
MQVHQKFRIAGIDCLVTTKSKRANQAYAGERLHSIFRHVVVLTVLAGVAEAQNICAVFGLLKLQLTICSVLLDRFSVGIGETSL